MAKRTASKRPRRKAPPRNAAAPASARAKPRRVAKKTAKKAVKRPKPVKPSPLPSAAAVEAVLAGIAHDIRTPLTGIVALAELLASSDLGPRERDWANAIKSGADHLAALSTLIVDAAKADATRLTLQREPFSPRGLAEAVGEALTARAANKPVETRIEIAPDLPATVAGDSLRLRAALENLADNAVKFTERGTVSLTAAAEPAARGRLRLVFTVTDSGLGISPAELKRLFRPFAQANEDIARRFGGAGLGLVFVRRVARAMGGDLKVTSKPGQGSAFRLTALVERVADRPAVASDGTPRPAARALSILCAEDNPYGRVVMNTIMRELGHKVDFVENGEAVVKAVAANTYDAVLMDVTLPGLDGVAATQAIRVLPGPARNVPVIGISGRGDAADEEKARAAGMNFYFVKPVSPGKLAQALSSLPSPRLQEEGGEPR
jgi:CheY-like chemotaxis protein/anti-sigma regulatory factor (Ser/Thr protein kinase)